MTNELESWLDEWSAKLDSVEEDENKEVFKIELFEKFASFVMKISSFPMKHFHLEGEEE
jgi:hypothetical protein